MLHHHLSLFLLEFEIQIPEFRRNRGIPGPTHEALTVLLAKRLATFSRRDKAASCLLLVKTHHRNPFANFCPVIDVIIIFIIYLTT